jgi:hypothetical protein
MSEKLFKSKFNLNLSGSPLDLRKKMVDKIKSIKVEADEEGPSGSQSPV